MRAPDADNINGHEDGQDLLSVFDADPEEFGGIYARQGFAFQDDVAANFYVQMLSETDLVGVSCETYDDILLVWQADGARVLEFVQVKAEHPDNLWSVAKLCERNKSIKNPDGIGTSILEKSLARDRYSETARFCIVTCRQIRSDLKLLTRERCHEHRTMSYQPFRDLSEDIGDRMEGVKSKKNNDIKYWLLNASWLVIQESNIGDVTKTRLAVVLHTLDLPYDPNTVREIYNNLRALAKETAEFDIEKWKEKHVSRDQLLNKLKGWINLYNGLGRVERLEQKLKDAELDQVCRQAAKDQQLFYLRKKRTPGYLNTEQAEGIEQQVLDTLHNLRSSLDSGRIKANGVEFHDLCLNEVRGLQPSAGSTAALSPGYLPGCMYEITARCRHRFTRFQS